MVKKRNHSFHLYADLYKILTNPPPDATVLSTTTKVLEALQNGFSKNIGLNEPKVSSQKISPISQNETKIEDIGIYSNTSEQPPNDVEEAKVNVSMDMIYLILIGTYRMINRIELVNNNGLSICSGHYNHTGAAGDWCDLPGGLLWH